MGQSSRPVTLLGVALVACSVFEKEEIPPFGEALVIVDTDLPVPRVVSRLRMDLYGENGAPFTIRDDIRPDPRDWPASFSVFTDDITRGRTVLVRLRAYPEGRLSDSGNGEPDPSVSVDRVVRLRLVPGRRGRVVVLLRGACVGVPASVVPDDVRSCTDGSPPAPIEDSPVEDSLSRDVPSNVGSYGARSCDDVRTSADRVCVPGGAFVLGDRFYRPVGETPLTTRPERIVRISRFVVDRQEVSVKRYRDAITRGFSAPIAVKATERDGPPGTTRDEACTFSVAPRGREDYPLSCVSWVTADAFCRFEGGSLPTEAQWEYVALAAARARKSIYAWGDDPPTCDHAVYARSAFSSDCAAMGEGPQEIGAASLDTAPLGVRDLGGGLEEHVVDSMADFSDACWTSVPPDDPRCTKPTTPECALDPASLECRLAGEFRHVTRGGGWTSFADQMRGIRRGAMQGGAMSEHVGFRCVYPAP